MPTKTRSPSRISREATATISSCAEYSLIAEVGRYRQPGLLDADGLDVDAPHVVPAIADPQDPFLKPGTETFDRPRPLRVVAMEGVVALEESLHGRWVRSARLVHHGNDLGLRKQDPIRVAQGHARVDDLLAGDDHTLGSEPRLFTDAQRAPRMRAAVLVGALHVHDGDVRTHSAHVHQGLTGLEVGVGTQDVAAEERARRQARDVPRRRPQGERDGEIRMVVDLDRPRHRLLARPAVAVPEALGHVADPSGSDAADT